MTSIDPHAFAGSYEFRSEGGDYTPTEAERAMIEDAICCFLAEAEPASADLETVERVSTDAAMSQWERSLKRPDLTEKDRVRGAIEAYKRQSFAFSMAAPTTGTSGAYPAGPAAPEKETRE
jgi:hypothetical protein